jgi:AraC family transcriptional regulator
LPTSLAGKCQNGDLAMHTMTEHLQTTAATQLTVGSTFGQIDRRCTTSAFVWVEASYAKGERLPLHAHESAYVCLNLGAEFSETTPGQREHGVMSGAVAAHPQGAAHANAFGEFGGRCLSVFSANRQDRIWTRALADRQLLPSAGTVRIRQALDDVQSSPCKPDAADLLIVEEELQDIVFALAFEHSLIASDGHGVARALQALRDAYAEPWTLDGLAQAAGRHPTHLARQVVLVTGLRLGDHLRRRRIARALQALRNGDKPVSEVAQDSGFADQAHLTRWMKRLTGLTPRSIRAHRNNSSAAKRPVKR